MVKYWFLVGGFELQVAMSCKAAGEGGGVRGGPEEKPGVCCLSPGKSLH